MFSKYPEINIGTQVFCALEELIGFNISLDPCLCLLNDDHSLNLGAMDKQIIFLGFNAAMMTTLVCPALRC